MKNFRAVSPVRAFQRYFILPWLDLLPVYAFKYRRILRADVQDEEVRSAIEATGLAEYGTMRPKKCLIVDDQESVRAYLKAILNQQHFQTIEAENGIQGLRLVEKLGTALDLIVSDIQMPGGDGLTFACAARESFPGLPIILVSGHPGSKQQGHSSACFEFVEKPFLPETLLTAVEKAMTMRIDGTVDRTQSRPDDLTSAI